MELHQRRLALANQRIQLTMEQSIVFQDLVLIKHLAHMFKVVLQRHIQFRNEVIQHLVLILLHHMDLGQQHLVLNLQYHRMFHGVE